MWLYPAVADFWYVIRRKRLGWITHMVFAVDIVLVTSPKIQLHRNGCGRPMHVMRRGCDPQATTLCS